MHDPKMLQLLERQAENRLREMFEAQEHLHEAVIASDAAGAIGWDKTAQERQAYWRVAKQRVDWCRAGL